MLMVLGFCTFALVEFLDLLDAMGAIYIPNIEYESIAHPHTILLVMLAYNIWIRDFFLKANRRILLYSKIQSLTLF
jgi:hypothetical protein